MAEQTPADHTDPNACRRAMLQDYIALSGQTAPATPALQDELAVRERADRPWPYATGDGRQVGRFLAGIGFALDVCCPRRGHRVLEIGATSAHLAFAMARMGCTVSLQTDDLTDMAALRRRADRECEAVTVLNDFSAAQGPFDFVLSQGGLRRRLDHRDLLTFIRDRLLAPGGRLLLVGEPLREDLPEPWMLDPGTTAIIRKGGSLELAYRPSYLLGLLSELGFNAELSVCPASPHGNTIVAGRRRGLTLGSATDERNRRPVPA